MRREIVNKLKETEASRINTNVEKPNYLRCLYREGDKVTRGSGVEVTFEIPVTLALEFLRGSHVEVVI